MERARNGTICRGRISNRIVWICSHGVLKYCGYIPANEQRQKYRFDIHSVISSHVETVVLLGRK